MNPLTKTFIAIVMGAIGISVLRDLKLVDFIINIINITGDKKRSY